MAPETTRANCGDDTSLFEYAQGGLGPDERQTLEAHVNACADCRQVLAEALRGLADAEAGTAAPESSRRRIGRYTLLELLGAGAAGVVYRAFDPELERTVALKLLRTDASEVSTEVRERRLREARTMAQVSNPNVVTVFDAGLSGAAVYIVMEYVQGSTLEEWLARERRTLREIVDAFVAAGRGLSALHARSIIHRDFKPENVMIGADGRIQVTDFGLARAIASVEAANARTGGALGSRMTLTQGLFGTPAYMAPELFEGKQADAQSDQWSFAVALLSAATGHHPFGADEPISVSELVLRLHRDSRELAEKATGLPSRLRDALVRALSVEPTNRFPTMAALLSELERAPIPRARGRARAASWLAIAALLIAGGALAFVLIPRQRTDRGPASGERADDASPPPRAFPATPPPVVSASVSIEAPKPEAAPTRNERSRSTVAANSVPAATKLPTRTGVRRPSRPATPTPSESRYDDRLKDPF